MKILNQIAQIRHIWELIEEKQTLWAIWVTSTKLKQLSFLGITKTIDSSWNWRNLLKLMKIVKPMVKYQLRDGKKKKILFGMILGAMVILLQISSQKSISEYLM